jgi:thiamine transporter ThiT
VQPVDFSLDVPDRFAQILHGVAFFAMSNQVFQSIPDAEILVFANRNGLNPRFMTGVMSGMVNWVFGLLHPYNLAKPALLSN